MMITKRGFSLIELSIVLAVVGLVIGGIYVAASAVNEKNRTQKTVGQLQQIIQNTRSAYSFVSTYTAPSYAQTKAYKIMPSSIVDTGTEFRNAYGGVVELYTPPVAVSTLGAAGRTYFGISFKGISKDSCIRLLTSFGTPQSVADMGIYDIGNGPTDVGIPQTADGVSTDDAVRLCNRSGTNNQADFEIALRR